MRKGVTLLETLIVIALAGIIMPFLFRMVTVTFDVVRVELDSRQSAKADLTMVLQKERQYIDSLSSDSERGQYFVKKGKIVDHLVILGEDK